MNDDQVMAVWALAIAYRNKHPRHSRPSAASVTRAIALPPDEDRVERLCCYELDREEREAAASRRASVPATAGQLDEIKALLARLLEKAP